MTGETTPTYIFGTHETGTLTQLADVATRAERVALMSDGHLGYIMPIGGVAAYRNQVSVVGVGFDIACGNAAIMTNLTLADLKISRLQLAECIQRDISFGVGRTNHANDAPVHEELFNSTAWDALPCSHREYGRLHTKAREQLGTVGSGNHYVDVFTDTQGRIWVGVHFGSRGLGHTIASGFLALGLGAKWGDKVAEQEVLLDLDSDGNVQYLGADSPHPQDIGDYYRMIGYLERLYKEG